MKYFHVIVMAVLLIMGIAQAALASAVHIEEWDTPEPGSFPHDAAVGPDGSLWYTGMRSNTLGRLDPKTGKIREYPLKTPDSGPHGLAADSSGNIWFTANFRGYIGKLDPETGSVTEFKMPDAAASDPHTLVFDRSGIIWFTVQAGDFVGRLDPRSGSITLKRPPTPGARPYGIAVGPVGAPFFCEFGTNKIGRIDPASFQITEYQLPKGARPRRLVITPDNIIYYTDYARGRLGRLDPVSGKVEERMTPDGRKSGPYGMAITPDGMIWFSETGIEPNKIVRFDPSKKNFTGWPVPSGGKVIRNMAATPEGEIYFTSSGANKVGIVRAGK